MRGIWHDERSGYLDTLGRLNVTISLFHLLDENIDVHALRVGLKVVSVAAASRPDPPYRRSLWLAHANRVLMRDWINLYAGWN